jgi:hypothetical protein
MSGRFDKLTQLAPKPPLTQRDSTQKPANPQAGKPASPQTIKPASNLAGKPASGLDGKPANPQAGSSSLEQVEKYTTRLEPSLIKKIKHYALEHDIKDYEVVQRAIRKLFLEER